MCCGWVYNGEVNGSEPGWPRRARNSFNQTLCAKGCWYFGAINKHVFVVIASGRESPTANKWSGNMAPCRFRSALVSEVDGWLCSADVFTGCIASCCCRERMGRMAGAPRWPHMLTHSPLRRSVPSLVSCFIKVISTYYSCTRLNLLVESVFTMSVEGNKSHEWNVKLHSPFKFKHERQMKIDIIIKLTHEVSSVMKDIKLNWANIQLNIFKQVMYESIFSQRKGKHNRKLNGVCLLKFFGEIRLCDGKNVRF